MVSVQHKIHRIGSIFLQGLLSYDTRVAPLLSSPSKTTAPERHFSAFPLTSHLHSPVLRLVSLHPSLSIELVFLRVMEIHDGFRWTVYLTRSTSVSDVIKTVCEQLGLAKSLPVPGGGNIDYVLEEKWSQDDESSKLL